MLNYEKIGTCLNRHKQASGLRQYDRYELYNVKSYGNIIRKYMPRLKKDNQSKYLNGSSGSLDKWGGAIVLTSDPTEST